MNPIAMIPVIAFLASPPLLLPDLEATLHDSHAQLEAEHAQFEAEHQQMEAEHAAMKAEHELLTGTGADKAHEALEAEHARLLADHAAIIAKHEALVRAHAEIEKKHAAGGIPDEQLKADHSRMEAEDREMGAEDLRMIADDRRITSEDRRMVAEHAPGAAPASIEAALRQEHAQLEGEHAGMEAEHARMEAEHAVLAAEHLRLKGTAEDAPHEALEAEHQKMMAGHTDLLARHKALTAQHAELEKKHSAGGLSDDQLKADHAAMAAEDAQMAAEDHQMMEEDRRIAEDEHRMLSEHGQTAAPMSTELALRAGHDRLEAEHAQLAAQHEEMEAEHEAMKTDHERLRGTALDSSHEQLEALHEKVMANHASVVAKQQALTAQHAQIEKQHAAGGLTDAQVAADHARMEAEDRQLEAQDRQMIAQDQMIGANHRRMLAEHEKSAIERARAISRAAVETSAMTMEITASVERVTSEILPSIGATEYKIDSERLDDTSGGDNAPVSQVLLRAPGVALDSFGVIHVRGEHANLQYRINGVVIPEGLENDFAPELDTRFIDTVKLVTGSLPAEFGFHTAGIIDVTTKNGSNLQGGEVSFYGGSYNTYNPSFAYGTNFGSFDFILSGSYKHDSLGLENPTASVVALHDNTDQERLFGYTNYQIDSSKRVGLLFSVNQGYFQIPDFPGASPAFTLAPSFGAIPPSSAINEHQTEQNAYAVLAYQQATDRTDFQVSAYARYGNLSYTPDLNGDLAYDGVATPLTIKNTVYGAQADASHQAGDLWGKHTIRAGGSAAYEVYNNDAIANVFLTDTAGNQSTNSPTAIPSQNDFNAFRGGVYLQDQWDITDALTVNYGARFDQFTAWQLDQENQLSPRVNVVWKAAAGTTLHAGYSRYFTPPSLQYVTPANVAALNGTTDAAGTTVDAHLLAERSHYGDLGASQAITKNWQVTVDGFYKQAQNLIDLGQFGAAYIFAPFNYRYGKVWGAEGSTNYHNSDLGLAAYFNLSYVEAYGMDIITSQYQFAPDDLAYIQNHWIHLDHEGEFTSTAGVAYNVAPSSKVFADLVFGSGLRRESTPPPGGVTIPNGGKEPNYYPLNLGAEHTISTGEKSALKVRADVVNVFDETIQLRNGSGVGVFAPQYASRRAYYGTLSYFF